MNSNEKPALNGKERQLLERRFTEICQSEQNLEKYLGGSEKAEQLIESFQTGVRNFYKLYQSPLTDKEIRERLERNLSGMDKKGQYAYLANILVALTHLCGAHMEDEQWEKITKEREAILEILQQGLLDMDNPNVEEEIRQMLDLISKEIQQASILFLDIPRYQELHEACMNKDMENVQALAVNTAEAAVYMAASLYSLHEEDKLPSLGKEKLDPESVGVMAASALEIDAAFKSGSWETAKAMINKALQAAITLLTASPFLLKGAVFIGLLHLLTNLSTTMLLVCGAIFVLNGKVHMSILKEHLTPVYRVGAHFVDVTVDAVHNVYEQASEWMKATVIPAVRPLWIKCRDFSVNRIILPAIAFLKVTKEYVSEAFSRFSQKIRDVVNHMKNQEESADTHENVSEQQDTATETRDEEDDLFLNDDETDEIYDEN